jgi:hypothetical protein
MRPFVACLLLVPSASLLFFQERADAERALMMHVVLLLNYSLSHKRSHRVVVGTPTPTHFVTD